MKIKNIQRLILYTLAAAIGTLILLYLAGGAWIGSEVNRQCRHAGEIYNSDCVDALISLLNDEEQGFEARNSAIWALGQIADRRALPALQSYYTGSIPTSEQLNQSISQYELKKAINLASGGINIIAWMRPR